MCVGLDWVGFGRVGFGLGRVGLGIGFGLGLVVLGWIRFRHSLVCKN
jgi:hypothetical protein